MLHLTEISSYRHEEIIKVEGEVIHVNFNYWVDMNNEYWYSYNDICSLIGINERDAENKFYYVPDDKKCTCMDSNHCNSYGEKQSIPTDYIASDEAHNIIQKHTMFISKRNSAIIKILNNLEFVGYSYEVHHDNEEIKERMKKIGASIKNNDYEELVYQSYMITKTDSARDILDKRGIINKEVEEMIDFIREDMYEYWDCFDEVFIPLNEKSDEDHKSTTIKYKKNKENNCPDWIRNIVK